MDMMRGTPASNRTIGQRIEAYEVCKERGHAPSAKVIATIPPWNVCRYCGTSYRSQSILEEQNVPAVAPEAE